MKVHGSCHCGQITFEGEVDPDGVVICHCTDCQQLTGSPFRTSVFTSAEHFQLLTGEPKQYIKVADSGAKRVMAFCADCGTPLYACAPTEVTSYNLRVGTLRERALLKPRVQIFRDSALPALCHLEGLPSFARGPA